ncbi:ArsR/SmtB family transcription factor [Actinoplanes palleronii]|uniref:Transcriptional regulator n=1 Tax=Actinoplanes palleronii TaxID=113570 RepID=A0ABQ4B367_9ACTN|nr:winged helix-turn-helix domain-containing protein [Actinoplanes palleronii]GIE65119.1 transcriptional regulator [Actinoplanes palleronii]
MPASPVVPGPHSLRGLAHPLRVRILGLLREHGASTATRLAGRLGESSGATSYHLRQLAAYGFVEDVPGRGVRRERWWRVASRSSAPVPAGAENYLRSVAVADFQRLQDFLGAAADLPPEWQTGVAIRNVALRLTPAQAGELLSRIGAVLTDYPVDDDPDLAVPGSARVVFQWQAFPLPARPDTGPPPGEQTRNEPRGDR